MRDQQQLDKPGDEIVEGSDDEVEGVIEDSDDEVSLFPNSTFRAFFKLNMLLVDIPAARV